MHTKTLADVGGDLTRITTYRQPDERMYQYSVDKALTSGKPVLLEFATPAHCTPCDRQLQMIKSLMEKYQDRMIFIHMDQYDNPEAYKAYGVPGDPWTFVIDGQESCASNRPDRCCTTRSKAPFRARSDETCVSSAMSNGTRYTLHRDYRGCSGMRCSTFQR